MIIIIISKFPYGNEILNEKGDTRMNKKIVVLTGSPRKNGNSFAMTEAFVHAAEAKGHQVKRFDTAMMR